MIRPGTSVNKMTNKSNLMGGVNLNTNNKEHTFPKFTDFLKKQDWVGAIKILELEKTYMKNDKMLWLAYCYFHIGEYRKGISIYDNLMKSKNYDKNIHIYKSCFLFALCNYDESKKEALKGPESSLQIRILYQIANKKNDENNLMEYYHKLNETIQDDMCRAAFSFFKGQFDYAQEIYKKYYEENKELIALYVYSALCYYKQDLFEISDEILAKYLSEINNSVIATNLKACNIFQLNNGKEAEDEFKKLEAIYEGGNLYDDFDILRHNLSVFRDGENALKVFPPLLDIFPEANLNLVIFYLKSGDFEEAYKRIKEIDPINTKEYMLKGVVLALYGQKKNNKDCIEKAKGLFQLIGTSATECDTIPGRQCVSSFLLLKEQYEESVIYLKSIKEFSDKDDEFNWNYGIALAKTNNYQEAEEALVLIQSEKYKSEYTYISVLARCFIMNKKPHEAWNLYIDMDTSNDTISILKLIGNDCYASGQFYYSLKAFDILERLDTNEEYSEQKLGSAVGTFYQILEGINPPEYIDEILNILKPNANEPQVAELIDIMTKNLFNDN